MDFNGDSTFRGNVRFLVDPIVQGSKINTVVPNISNIGVLVCNYAVPTTITNFTGGANNKTIRVLGDGNATVKNGTNIFTNIGADKLLKANGIYTFTLINNIWYENAS